MVASQNNICSALQTLIFYAELPATFVGRGSWDIPDMGSPMRFEIAGLVAPHGPIPTASQVVWQRGEFAIFVHFGMNTFSGREWGDGTESPAMFNPTNLDARQWAAAAKAAGASHLILTAKHHDGFCLWPSAYTEHSVRSSPWRSGRGDLIREFVDACRLHGLKAGLYLSPWDRHERTYGDSPAYNAFYLNQLRELLTNYGQLCEIWFDGACAEGPNGRRQVYDWEAFFKTCQALQPGAVTFGDGGTDVRWIGNERGVAGDPNWSTVDPRLIRYPGDSGIDQANDAIARGAVFSRQLQNGVAGGSVWQPGESDVSIRPGWFYHESEDQAVRSVENLIDLYFKSVGRNSMLLLNIPPTKEGLFHQIDVDRLRTFRSRLDQIFSPDLTEGARVIHTDGRTIEIRFQTPVDFDVIGLEEHIELGQRVGAYRVFYQDTAGIWQWLIEGHTIGCKKLDRFDSVTAIAIKLVIQHALAIPLIRAITVHRSR
jgi:alpha-L-fucosidase